MFLAVVLKYLTRSNSREGVLGDEVYKVCSIFFFGGVHVILGHAVHHGEEDMAVEARGRK